MAIYRRATRWMFGEEGDVIADSEAQVVIAANAILITGAVVLSPLISDLGTVFSVSETRAGLLIIVYTATLAVSLPVAGVIADRVGRKVAAAPGVAVFGLAGAAIGLATTFELALALRIVQAIGAAFAHPILIALLGDLYSGEREATAQGIRVALDSVVSMTAPLVAGILFVVSWRYPFAIYLLAVPAAAWLWFGLPDLGTPQGRGLWDSVRDLASVVRDRAMGALMASLFVRMVLMYGLLTYVSVLAIREAGMAVVAVGALLSARSLAKLVSSAQAGRLATAYHPALVALLGFVLAGGGLLLMGALPVSAALFAGVTVYGLGDGLLSPAQKSLVNQLSPPEHRGGSMSAALTFQNVGKTVGPLGLAVVLAALGPSTAFALLGLVGGGAGVGLLAGVWLWRVR